MISKQENNQKTKNQRAQASNIFSFFQLFVSNSVTHQDPQSRQTSQPSSLDANLVQDHAGGNGPAEDDSGDRDVPGGGAHHLGAVDAPRDGVRRAGGRVAADGVGFLGEQVARGAEEGADGRGTECHFLLIGWVVVVVVLVGCLE